VFPRAWDKSTVLPIAEGLTMLSRLRQPASSTGPEKNEASAGSLALQNCRDDSDRECAKFASQEQEQTQISGFEVALAYLVLTVPFLGMAWVAVDMIRKVAYSP
jgi:hypothetical protein